ncbi:MAG: AMMECR1 domain-containing protein [Planctomycetota bacterium]|nr:AMMECR1 domain-containing protein [Planctomycetota bacterium]
MDTPTRRKLLAYCRGVLTQVVANGELPKLVTSDPQLTARSGAFVTLHRKGELRGCIGHILADTPLWQTVRDVTVSAALHDPRFHPVTASGTARKSERRDFRTVPSRRKVRGT